MSIRLTSAIRKNWVPALIITLLLLGSCYSYLNQGIVYFLFTRDIGSVSDVLSDYGALAAVVFCSLVVLEVIVAPIPPFVLYIAGGLVFGPILGGTLALASNVVGAVIAFWIARRYGRGFVERSITPKARATFDRLSDKYGVLSIFLLRLNVFTSSDAFSYLAGLSAMSYRGFALGTTLGLAPIIYLQTYIGYDLLRENPTLFLIFVVMSLIYLVLFLYGILYVRLKGKNKERDR
ncbi:TVP38/TMEM64 family protein [Candidatus Neomarinimicrobiota bacterium]